MLQKITSIGHIICLVLVFSSYSQEHFYVSKAVTVHKKSNIILLSVYRKQEKNVYGKWLFDLTLFIFQSSSAGSCLCYHLLTLHLFPDMYYII